jgi:uncharacterized membrane protein
MKLNLFLLLLVATLAVALAAVEVRDWMVAGFDNMSGSIANTIFLYQHAYVHHRLQTTRP